MQRNPKRPLVCRGLRASFSSKTTLAMAVRRWGGKRKMWEMGAGDSAITRPPLSCNRQVGTEGRSWAACNNKPAITNQAGRLETFRTCHLQ